MPIRVKRVYDPPEDGDGLRILVDRLWPRGLSKESARIDQWLRDVAPSASLRKWFGHDPDKWEQFQRCYFEQLDEVPEGVSKLRSLIRGRTVTLVFAAKNETHNNAVALKRYLQRSQT